jgi:hypothetical protein
MSIKEIAVLIAILAIGYWLGTKGIIGKFL